MGNPLPPKFLSQPPQHFRAGGKGQRPGLGATAAQSFMGRAFRVAQIRWSCFFRIRGLASVATYHDRLCACMHGRSDYFGLLATEPRACAERSASSRGRHSSSASRLYLNQAATSS
jgi:hypothetical protein